MTQQERKMAATIAAHESWANTENRTARTAPARRALEAKWLAQAGGDPVRAEHLRKAHYQRMALASARARRKARELTAEADAADTALAEAGDAA